MRINHNEIFKYYQQGVYPAVNKLYAFGDIHGDFNSFILCLTKAGLIDNNHKWCGGDSHVVQVGDILDRKTRDNDESDEDSEFKIISLILKLQIESYIAGGGFHPIIGNHEIMNIFGMFDYVSPMGMAHFKSPSDRQEYFKIGGIFARYLACAWNPIVKIGDFIFCHGGLSLEIAEKYKIEQINLLMRDTLYGNFSNINNPIFYNLFMSNYSILWNRTYSTNISKFEEVRATRNLTKILSIYNAKYLVLGHTPTNGSVKLRFNGRVLCIDTGMSSAFGVKEDKMERIHFIEVIHKDGKNIINLY
jgi:hypothetical protein